MINYPKIIFKYSNVYDRRCRELWKKENKRKKYPSRETVLHYVKKAESFWKRKEKMILKEISKITNLKWGQESIECFVVGRCRPFAYPLTVPIYERNFNCFIDVLIHELIHQLFLGKENKKRVKKAWAFFNKKYRKETITTRIHILTYAIHSFIYAKFFGRDRLESNIKRVSSLKDYKKAWQIVQEQGYQDIINEFLKRV